MAYDPGTGQLVLFGGYDGGFLDDTWTWNGSTWTQMTPATSPPARDSASMAYDPGTGQLVLFGGWDEAQHLQRHLDLGWQHLAAAVTGHEPATAPRGVDGL